MSLFLLFCRFILAYNNNGLCTYKVEGDAHPTTEIDATTGFWNARMLNQRTKNERKNQTNPPKTLALFAGNGIHK
jgi:hypothetical protein